MKSKHFMHWFFGGGENEQIDRSESSREHLKKKPPSWIAPNYECEWKGPLGTKKQWIQWIQRDDICYTYVSNQLCQQTALKFLPPLLQHAFHSFIHLFALSLISPSTVKVFFFLSSVAFQTQWMSINHFQFFAFYMAFLLPISNLGRGKWC